MILERATTGKIKKPSRIMVYGEGGIGKTTWASRFPNAIFLATEDGTNSIDCSRVLLDDAVDTVKAAIECSQSDYDTIVVDSIDWFNALLEKRLDEDNFDGSFGKLAVELARMLKKLLDALDRCVEAGKNVIVVAHNEVRRSEDIAGNTWDRISPKLPKRSCDLLIEWCDIVLMAKRDDFVRKEKGDFGKEINVATTSGRRILCTTSHPSYVAKTRIKLPATIDMNDQIDLFLTGETL